VSRRDRSQITPWLGQFQSRAGFSECLDIPTEDVIDPVTAFQSRAGFSECLDCRVESGGCRGLFQSRAGFSECLDRQFMHRLGATTLGFQSRAGFSECLDGNIVNAGTLLTGFNPVLGFLSVST